MILERSRVRSAGGGAAGGAESGVLEEEQQEEEQTALIKEWKGRNGRRPTNV